MPVETVTATDITDFQRMLTSHIIETGSLRGWLWFRADSLTPQSQKITSPTAG